jgi:hypothetical protein
MHPGACYKINKNSDVYTKEINFIGALVKGLDDQRSWTIEFEDCHTVKIFVEQLDEYRTVKKIEALDPRSCIKMMHIGNDKFFIIHSMGNINYFLEDGKEE